MFHAQLLETSRSRGSQSARRPILPSTSARPMALQQWNHLRWAISTHIGDGSKIQKQRRNKSPRNTNLQIFFGNFGGGNVAGVFWFFFWGWGGNFWGGKGGCLFPFFVFLKTGSFVFKKWLWNTKKIHGKGDGNSSWVQIEWALDFVISENQPTYQPPLTATIQAATTQGQ